MKKGFTLVELMVASLLLAMLVTILTMMFNQSSIAWRTGTAGVSDLNGTRWSLGAFHDIRDDVLPGLGDRNVTGGSGDSRTIKYRTMPLWDDSLGENKLRARRAFSVQSTSMNWGRAPSFTVGDAMTAAKKGVEGAGSGKGSSLFTVGVRSAGPNGNPGDEDDITTWPEEID